jgi:hypothetical protein
MSQHPFDLGQLLGPGLAIFLVLFVVSFVVLRRPVASLVVAALKAGLFVAYFASVFDGTFTYLDDWTYFERGAYIHESGIGLSNLIESLPLLVAIGEGDHFLYFLYNAIAFDWFGTGYYAPVALNVIVTGFIALLGMRLARTEQLVDRRLAPVFFLFLLLHPDITAWSSLVNGKDTLVLLLHVMLLTAISQYLRGCRLAALLLAGISVAILFFLRFYVPLMFAVAFGTSMVLQLRGAARLRVGMVAIAILGGLVVAMGGGIFSYAADSLRAEFVNPALGLLRFLLTPIPFNTEASFAFLDVPALVHWLMLPALLLGAWRIHRLGTPFSRLLVLYALTFAALYALYGELQGPRHRLQLDYAFALFQFAGVGALAQFVTRWSASRAGGSTPAGTARGLLPSPSATGMETP